MTRPAGILLAVGLVVLVLLLAVRRELPDPPLSESSRIDESVIGTSSDEREDAIGSDSDTGISEGNERRSEEVSDDNGLGDTDSPTIDGIIATTAAQPPEFQWPDALLLDIEEVDPDWAPEAERELRGAAERYLSMHPDLREKYSLTSIRCRTTVCEITIRSYGDVPAIPVANSELRRMITDLFAQSWGEFIEPNGFGTDSTDDGYYESRSYHPRLDAIEARIASMEQLLDVLRGRYTEGHPTLVMASRRLDFLREQL